MGPIKVDVEAGPSGLSTKEKDEIKQRSASPPAFALVLPAVEPAKADSGVIDLTLSDSDDDGDDKKPLKRRRNGDPITTPTKPKLESKPPDLPRTPPSRPSPRKLVSDDGSPPPDLSHFAHDTQHLLKEPPEAILALLSSDELKSLGKKMKVPVGSAAPVSH